MIRIKKLDSLIATSFIPPFIVTFMIATFTLLMQILWLYIDDLAGKGLGFFLVMELLGYKCVSLVPLALPLAVLISSVMVMGNLAEHYELSSMKSAGIPLLRIMRPLLFFGVGAAALSFMCNNYFIPVSNLKFGSRMWDIQRQKPTLRLDAGVFNDDFDGFSIHIGKKKGDDRHVEDILIYDHSGNSQNKFSQIVAQGGEMYTTADGNFFIMQLHDGHQYIEVDERQRKDSKHPFVRTTFSEWTKVFDLSEFQLRRTDEELFKSSRSMLSAGQLQTAVDSINAKIALREQGLSNYMANYFGHLEQDTSGGPAQPKPRTDPKADKAYDDANRDGAEGTDRDAGKENHGYAKDAAAVFDTFPNFVGLYKAELSLYQQKNHMNRAQTFARSIHNQAEAAKRTLEGMSENRVKHVYDLHMKYSTAVVCFIFLFIGAPMGAIIRKGGFGYPILVAIIFFMLFIVMSIMCRKLAESFVVSALFAAWIPCIVLTPVGMLLTYKAMNDSKLLDLDRYSAFFAKVFRRKQTA